MDVALRPRRDDGVRRVRRDPADVVRDLDVDVPVLPPPVAPGVAHDPVLPVLVVRPPPDQRDRVAEQRVVVKARCIVQYTSRIIQKSVSHHHSDRHWAVKKCLFCLVHVKLGDPPCVRHHILCVVHQVRLAPVVLPQIRVVHLERESGRRVREPPQRHVRRAALAPVVVLVRVRLVLPKTINNRLLREGNQRRGGRGAQPLDVDPALQGARRAEGPARPAGNLVLDEADRALDPPVHVRAVDPGLVQGQVVSRERGAERLRPPAQERGLHRGRVVHEHVRRDRERVPRVRVHRHQLRHVLPERVRGVVPRRVVVEGELLQQVHVRERALGRVRALRGNDKVRRVRGCSVVVVVQDVVVRVRVEVRAAVDLPPVRRRRVRVEPEVLLVGLVAQVLHVRLRLNVVSDESVVIHQLPIQVGLGHLGKVSQIREYVRH